MVVVTELVVKVESTGIGDMVVCVQSVVIQWAGTRDTGYEYTFSIILVVSMALYSPLPVVSSTQFSRDLSPCSDSLLLNALVERKDLS